MRIALGVEYNGENYCGWQRQKQSPSVQEHIEKTLSQIADQPVKVFCAGRTDTGVHATNQVIHFDMQGSRPAAAWLRGANNYLPKDVSITWVKEVDDHFHARFSAINRSYRYIIQNTSSPAAILAGKVTWYRPLLDAELMQQAAQFLLGQQNFSSFQASSCQANTSTRIIRYAKVSRMNDLIFIDIKANAFLHHMVRNIVGCLLRVGEGRESPDFVEKIIGYKDRTKAPDTASPHGLYLINVEYPAEFKLPLIQYGPLGLSIFDGV